MSDKPRYDHTLLIFLAALFIFNSPLSNWWSKIGLPWYTIFLVWAGFIFLVIVNNKRDTDDGN